MGLQITDDADIARDDRGGTCKMAGWDETRPPSLPAVSWSSHMSPNKCAPFAGVELLPTPLCVPIPPQRAPGSRGAGETEGRGEGIYSLHSPWNYVWEQSWFY